MFKRHQTRRVMVGDVAIGGGAPIPVQSMTTTDTTDIKATLGEIKRLEDAGCDIVRVSTPNRKSVDALEKILPKVQVPIVADIHFDHSVALRAAEIGVAKLRINPGNIGTRDKVKKVVSKAKENKLPIRIGVNAGSLEKDILEKHGYPTAEAMVESALRHIKILEDNDFFDTVVSVKASSVPLTIESYRLLAKKVDYPLHLGITESGTLVSGSVYSAVGLGILLNEGIGDTIRVSLTADVVEEVRVGRKILASLDLATNVPRVISCPSCARNHLDLFQIAEEVERRTADLKKPVKIAVMGCAVNGPGEAREADFGIMGGKGSGQIFVHGKIVKKVPEDRLVDELEKEIRERLSD
ncbi:MAG: flavodoxin-dependent (E)-4-hydroxy-3-methylbut-2-enyl-diphosphate synthase [Candidatus Latescibacterota bacterium]|nr:MAG: flavodoxin-dependent (E)-4-hydroxy-3-methylbut-2-enyl-diphosphate synthase [Candidatus Latescibacterota bacterium]